MEFNITTFNLENLGIRPGEDSPEARRRLPVHLETLKGVVSGLGSDILCVQEIIDPELLANVTKDLGLTHTAISKPPKNPLCMAVLSRFPIIQSKSVVATTHIEARDIDAEFFASVEANFSRPVFEVEIDLGGKTLVVYTVHWKSKIPTALSSGAGHSWPWASFFEVAQGRFISEVTRMAQAMGLRKIIDARLAQNPDALIAVAGDFNDVMDSEAVRMILGDAKAVRSQELYNLELWPCELMVEAETRYTMVYRGTRQMLDHIFVSRGLRERFKSAHINHKGMKPAKEGGWNDMRPGSDHAPFTASFSLKDQ